MKADKKQYYALDDIGFIGIQGRSKAEIKKDREIFTKFFKKKKTEKLSVVSEDATRYSKAKK